MIRVDGDVRRINMPALDHKSRCTPRLRHHERQAAQGLRRVPGVDFSFEIPGLARFRVNAFNQNRGAGAVFRTIPSKILTWKTWDAPKVFKS
jgi:twitching motility protein PilT